MPLFKPSRLAHSTGNIFLDDVISRNAVLPPHMRRIVNFEILRLQDQVQARGTLDSTALERARTLERLARFCPFRELPDDIVYMIFTHCEDMVLATREPETTSWALFPVAQVSRQWRLQASSFRSYVEYFTRSNRLKARQRSKAAAKIRSSDQLYTLTISLGAGVCAPPLSGLDHLVEIHLTTVAATSGVLANWTISPPLPFSCLQVVTIHLQSPLAQPLVCDSPFARAPNLRVFEITAAAFNQKSNWVPPQDIIDPRLLELPWSRLERLVLTGARVDLGKLINLLGFCSTLSHLSVNCTSEGDPAGINPGRRLNMSQLRVLRVFCPANDMVIVFAALFLPRLEDLEIYPEVDGRSNAEWFTPQCALWVIPSVGALRRLSISATKLTTHAICAVLHAACKLEILMFRFVGFGRDIARCLRYHDTDAQDFSHPGPALLPNLRVLSFGDCEIIKHRRKYQESLNRLLRVIESRYWTKEEHEQSRPSVRALDTAFLCGDDWRDFTDDMYSRIDACRSRGLDIALNYDPDDGYETGLALPDGDGARPSEVDELYDWKNDNPMDAEDYKLVREGTSRFATASWCSTITVKWR